jgi:hypothetical protein
MGCRSVCSVSRLVSIRVLIGDAFSAFGPSLHIGSMNIPLASFVLKPGAMSSQRYEKAVDFCRLIGKLVEGA